MSEPAPEFSRLVQIVQLGAEPFRQRIEATAEEREKLSRRFDLLSLDRLIAEVVLRRQSGGVVLLEAEFQAEFEQCCAVTLDPVRGGVSDHFSLAYGPPTAEEQEIALSSHEPAFEPLVGDTIDIGEAVAQELSLALPVFPRHPDAVIDRVPQAGRWDGPLAALAYRRKDVGC
ncbi:MAG: DUF177 domain-containing protein [Stellaceae bacterium]